ncbi:MAG: FAD-dependent oxidoreductase [Tatlockia sp.]|nr:FAD-dependent oxidoreductase [Tatlockia sp.]
MPKVITKKTPRLAIIGAGPSGLAVGQFLNEPCEILEAKAHVGGHAASFQSQGFTFDYGPHILFSRDQAILDFIIAILGQNVSRCKRNNKILFKDKLLKYPFENNLSALDLEDNYECIRHFIFNPYQQKYAVPTNMREWFLKTFGEGICTRYLFPYNEKVWNVPVEELSMSMSDRIPNPPAEDILKSALGYNTEGYLHQLYYFYPKKGGYQAISEALKKGLSIRYNFKVNKIQRVNERLRVLDALGNFEEYEQLISTMPVHELLNQLDFIIPEEIAEAAEQLIVNPMFVISFGIKGVDTNQFTAVYFPEPEFLVNRISFPCTFSEENGPKGHWSLQAEITCAKNSPNWLKSNEEILTHVREGLQQRKILPEDEQIIFTKIERVENSYVVYNQGYEEKAQKLREWFATMGIHLLGRFSYFEYINVDMAISRATKLAALFNEDSSTESTKTDYLAKALAKITKIEQVEL